MAIELAAAYVTIIPSLKGATRQITSQLAGVDTSVGSKLGEQLSDKVSKGFNVAPIAAKFESVGSSISGVGGKLTSGITKPVGLAATAVTGLVTALGFKRLVGIDTARGQFKGLGHDADAVMAQVDKGVTNTALSMAEGASLAVGILATGNLPLGELESQLKRVANVSAAYGVDASQAGYLLNNVLTKNKVTYGDLSQMVQNQIPIISMLADHYGVTGEEIMKMAQEGEISIEDFNKVLDSNAGAAAEEYAKTWKGVTSNIMSNIGRMGAQILDSVFPQMKAELGDFLALLKSDDAKAFAADVGKFLGEAFTQLTGALKSAITWWNGLSPAAQKTIGVFAGVAIAAGPVLKVVGAISKGIGGLVTGFGKTVTFATSMGKGIKSGFDTARIAGMYAGDGIKAFGQNIKIMGMLAKDSVASGASKMASGFKSGLDSMRTAATFAGNQIKLFGQNVKVTALLAKDAALAFGVKTKAIVLSSAAWVKNAAVMVAQKAVLVASTVATKAATVAQKAFNLVLRANPIGLIITAIAALVAGLIWFFTQTELGQAIWANFTQFLTEAWANITTFLTEAWTNISTFFTTVWTNISSFFTNTWNNIVATARAVAIAIAIAIINVVTNVQATWNAVWSAVSGFFSRVWSGIVSAATGFMSSVKSKFTAVTDFVKGIPLKIVGFFAGMASKLISSGRALIQGFLDGIMAGFNKAKDFVSGGLAKIRDLFPFSPAKDGPFSGRGWVLYAGLSLGSTFTSAIADSLHDGRSEIADELGGIEDEFSKIEAFANGSQFNVRSAVPASTNEADSSRRGGDSYYLSNPDPVVLAREIAEMRRGRATSESDYQATVFG